MSSQESYWHITAEEFAKLDYSTVTLLDLREPDEVPKEKSVIVFCRVGDWSEQVAEILADRGYDAATLDGVELGGVSTFLGSGEESDMSLFI